MANKSLFSSLPGLFTRPADTVNEAGGSAHAFSAEHALAQYAVTGCLNSTFYADAGDQLQKILDLAWNCEPEFVARTALFARQRGRMKDVPALLVASLSLRSPGLMAEVFDRVIDNGRMLRTFVQIMRSGTVGRKSMGTLPKRLVRQWLEQRTDEQVFRASVGNAPSLADIVKMVHPRPATPSRAALYGWMLGRDHDAAALPPLVRAFEAFKRLESRDVPDVPHEMLTALPLDAMHWRAIARHASWQVTRQGLNTFARHGVFDDADITAIIAERLRSRDLIARARVLPYQLMVTHANASQDVPRPIKDALHDAMEIAIESVPEFRAPGPSPHMAKVWVCPDVSGSMQSPITGARRGSTTVVRCVDVAALVAAAILRRTPGAEVIPFSDHVVDARVDPRDSVLTNARLLASLPAGGTNCSAPLAELNHRHAHADLVVLVSDNQSWVDTNGQGQPTETMRQWAKLKKRCPHARLVAIDLQPNGTTQAHDREDILNVGGFSDHVFEVLAHFASGQMTQGHWVSQIRKVSI